MSGKETALFESAQALFCSIADKLGSTQSKKILNKDKFPTFSDFQNANQKLIDDALKQVDIDVGVVNVYNYLGGYDPKDRKKTFKTTPKGTSWYHSSISIANKIVESLDTVPGFKQFKISSPKYESKMFYYRGDEEVMSKIGELFSIAKGSKVSKKGFKDNIVEIKDINKWNPADIYLANKEGIKGIADELVEANKNKTSYSFDYLNEKIKNLMDKGALLPLSLKKTKTDAKLVKVNFVEASKDQVLKNVNFVGTTNWQPYKMLDKTPELSFIALKKGGKTETRDIKIILTAEGKQGEIKIRHDPSGSSSTGRLVIELIMKGDAAKGGSIASQIALSDLWKTIDQKAANDFLQAYNKGVKEFSKLKKEYLKVKDKLRSDKNPSKGDANKYDHYLAIASATNIVNGVMPIIKKWFNDNSKGGGKSNSNKFLRLLYQIATSRSPLSCRFSTSKIPSTNITLPLIGWT